MWCQNDRILCASSVHSPCTLRCPHALSPRPVTRPRPRPRRHRDMTKSMQLPAQLFARVLPIACSA